jgi:NAD(P)-dependent dehydrogenase (short-subunit alcohol dehydrogenase family)
MSYYKNIFSLKNKLAFVIGGSGLIGKEVVKCLLQYRATVINLDIKKNRLCKENIFFDCSDLFNFESNYLKVIKNFGVPHILINCSYPRSKDWKENTFLKIKNKSFYSNIQDHFNSYILLSRITGNLMVKKKIKGSIILLGSIYSIVGQDMEIYKKTNIQENLTYSVIKGGIISFTKQMASFYGKYNIRVNCVCPGGVLDKKNLKDVNFIKNYSKRVPLRRLGRGREISNAILFLSSNASSYITGSVVMVDGGWTCI